MRGACGHTPTYTFNDEEMLWEKGFLEKSKIFWGKNPVTTALWKMMV
jgi:hypothetical protein